MTMSSDSEFRLQLHFIMRGEQFTGELLIE